MNTIIILVVAFAIALFIIIYSFKTAEKIDETPVIKFQPRQVIDLSKGKVGTDPIAKPKRKYKKRNKKKPTVAENTPVEKRPVGRPKISK